MVLITQETMNFWKQTTHIMSYFKEENFRGDKRLPNSFMTGFLEVSLSQKRYGHARSRGEHQGQEQGDEGHSQTFDAVSLTTLYTGPQLRALEGLELVYINIQFQKNISAKNRSHKKKTPTKLVGPISFVLSTPLVLSFGVSIPM